LNRPGIAIDDALLAAEIVCRHDIQRNGKFFERVRDAAGPEAFKDLFRIEHHGIGQLATEDIGDAPGPRPHDCRQHAGTVAKAA